MKKNILVTCALPYANGPIHLGHMLEHIQADIWVRYNRMIGNNVYFICADDAHGTAIMLKSKSLGIKPEKIIKKINLEHQSDLLSFNVVYDNYYSTHSKENKVFLYLVYRRLKNKGLIKFKNIDQFFDCKKKIFLPDRFVVGQCPMCNASKQYGDSCEVCGNIYKSTELINPKSVLSNTTPVLKVSKHLFFDLPVYKDYLFNLIKLRIKQRQVINKIQEWFNIGLKQWNISRDAPYFGFNIPRILNKYFYVWLDATVGYMSTFYNLCKKNKKIKFLDFWSVHSKYELYHFIGKDIIYFHSLFLPAILHGSNFRSFTNLFVHGHVTINNVKMSKSKGNLVTAKEYLKKLDSDYLRYYYAAKLSLNINDIDLNFKDLEKKINSELINKVLNIASRSSKLLYKNFNNELSNNIADYSLYKIFVDSEKIIKKLFEECKLSLVVKQIIYLADLANAYIDRESPWKINGNIINSNYHSVCSMGIHLFRILMIYLKPIVPKLAKRAEIFLLKELNWKDIRNPLLSHKINKFKILLERIEIDKLKIITSNT